MSINISFKSILSESWQVFKRNWKFFMGAFIFMGALNIIVSLLTPGEEEISPVVWRLGMLLNLAYFVFSIVFSFNMAKITLHAIREGEYAPRFSNIFEFKGNWYGKYFWVSLVAGAVQIIGFILLIIPGIILAVRLVLVPYIAVEKKISPKEALKESWERTRGYGWKIFGFSIVMVLFAIITIPAFLITIPLLQIMIVVLYNRFSSNGKEVVVQSPEIEAPEVMEPAVAQ